MKEMIQGLFEEYVRKHDLDEYAKKIIYTTAKNSFYVADNQAIYLAEESIMENNRIHDIALLKLKKALYHELTHAMQHKIRHNERSLRADIFRQSFIHAYNNRLSYELNHSIYPTEYNAEINALIEIGASDMAIKDFIDSRYIDTVYFKQSPVEIFKTYANQELDLTNDYTNAECILYGLPYKKFSKTKLR